MRFFAFLMAALVLTGLLSGCLSKQVSETTDSIIGDVKNFGEKATQQH